MLLRSLLVGLASLAAAAPIGARDIIYVDASATGANTGKSWQDAFTDLQAAIDKGAKFSTNDQIWVAAGTYRPTSTIDRAASFRLQEDSVFGGFDGTEATLEERAGLFDETILSGDTLGDDGPGFTNRADNCYHVVTSGSEFWGVLDGFHVRGGHADGSLRLERFGGGFATVESFAFLRIENCRFEDNWAEEYGGGVGLTYETCVDLTACTFRGNATAGYGGGAAGSCIGRVERCRFVANVAGISGGGLEGADAFDCLFAGNVAGQVGGGSSGTVPSGCTYVGNHAARTGGAHGYGEPTARAENCIFHGNTDPQGGGLDAQTNFLAAASCIEGCAGVAGYETCWDADPRFVDPDGPNDVPFDLDDDWGLRVGSTCIDGADPTLFAGGPVDVAGRPRFVDSIGCADSTLDVGAYERQHVDGRRTICTALPSSTGAPAKLLAPCSLSLSETAFVVLSAAPVPPGFGVFRWGNDRARVPAGDGVLCVGGTTLDLAAGTSYAGTLKAIVHLPSSPLASLPPGTAWHVQAIFRDVAAGGAGFNLSDAVTVTVLP